LKESNAHGFYYKFSIFYKNPFWRKNGYSGQVLSINTFIIGVFDGVNDKLIKYGKLIGFLDQDYFDKFLSKESEDYRKNLILNELTK
jgi:monoamine oxidase